MIVTRAAIVVGVLLYGVLWFFALHGDSALAQLLAVPVILVVLVAGGGWLTRYLGITPKSPKFHDRDDDES